MDKLKELLKEKKETKIELFYYIIAFLFFPVTGFLLLCIYIHEYIIDLHNINKKIKEQKIKEIVIKDILIIKDESGNIKDIKF